MQKQSLREKFPHALSKEKLKILVEQIAAGREQAIQTAFRAVLYAATPTPQPEEAKAEDGKVCA